MNTSGTDLTATASVVDLWNPALTYPSWPSYAQPAVTYNVIQTPRCAWCQGTHTDKCPDLKSVTYRSDGTVERVEFWDRAER